MNSTAKRLVISMLIPVLIGIVISLVVYLLYADESSLSEAVRQRFSDDPLTISEALSTAYWEIVFWCALSIVLGIVFSSMWLVIAERQRPANRTEGASMLSLWLMFFVLNVLGMMIIGYIRVWSNPVSNDLTSGVLIQASLLVAFGTALAYFLATAIGVKTVMRPSVPGSGVMPNLERAG